MPAPFPEKTSSRNSEFVRGCAKVRTVRAELFHSCARELQPPHYSEMYSLTNKETQAVEGKAITFMLGIILRNLNTINMFTSLTISHRDNKPMNSGLLGKAEERNKSEPCDRKAQLNLLGHR